VLATSHDRQVSDSMSKMLPHLIARLLWTRHFSVNELQRTSVTGSWHMLGASSCKWENTRRNAAARVQLNGETRWLQLHPTWLHAHSWTAQKPGQGTCFSDADFLRSQKKKETSSQNTKPGFHIPVNPVLPPTHLGTRYLGSVSPAKHVPHCQGTWAWGREEQGHL